MNATKPFCLEHAKAGAPYACYDGTEATIVKWDGRNKDYPLVGYFGPDDEPTAWSTSGRHSIAAHPLDLFMTPLGMIDGKPVFVGDEYRMDSEQLFASPITRDFTGCRWPAPEKQYPVTLMMPHEVARAWQGAAGERIADLYSFANAALCHAIDSGQVVTKEDHEAALVRLGEQLRDIAIGRNPARDMAIAEAVRDAAVRGAAHAHLCFRGLQAADLDLAAIIAKVTK